MDSVHTSPETKAGAPSKTVEGGEELSRVQSPVIVRDFGSPLASSKASLKKPSTLPPPRIFIQRASDASEPGTTCPPSAPSEPDKQLRDPYQAEDSDQASELSQDGDPLASRITIPPETASNLSHDIEDSQKRKVKKRKLVVRKSRNLLMRKHFLQMCLGRELAAQTKPALRRLAKGEPVAEETDVASERHVVSHSSDGSTENLLGSE